MNFHRNDKISTGSHPPTKKITPTYMDLAYLHASGGIFALVESLELSHIPKFLTQFFSCPKIHVMQGPSVIEPLCMKIRVTNEKSTLNFKLLYLVGE